MPKIIFVFFLIAGFVQGQEPLAFAEEVAEIQKKYDTLWDSSKETIVFTGSSSIRIWDELQQQFPKHQIVNSGFGGSQASDLLHHMNTLILAYQPKKVFIYEGDNDIANGKDGKTILSTILEVIGRIRQQNSAVKIVLISAKPSLARWNLKRDYKRLNRKFKKLSRKDADVLYADVWKPMLTNGKLKKDIFSEDGLHMNAKGYAIWSEVLRPFVEQ